MPAISCPQCSAAGNVPDQFIGQTVRCRKCQGTILVSAPAPTLAPPATADFGFAERAADAPPDAPRAPVRFKREPWYYSFCYRMTLVLICLSIMGVLIQALLWFGFSTAALADDPSYRSFPTTPPPKPMLDPGFVRGVVWFLSNFLVVFWSILVILWILYIFGFALIFIDAARWIRRYCEHSLR